MVELGEEWPRLRNVDLDPSMSLCLPSLDFQKQLINVVLNSKTLSYICNGQELQIVNIIRALNRSGGTMMTSHLLVFSRAVPDTIPHLGIYWWDPCFIQLSKAGEDLHVHL